MFTIYLSIVYNCPLFFDFDRTIMNSTNTERGLRP
ncbi:hypothetical protein BACCAP_01643 [Pseudoflavonifractor capillosus ATCC 29799]|uniref:Uncharacterized protein n=1 Tax=Pseudoflavonifractor capillosus ATCC 29799 TaxID=411467 RepID=A6NTW3_9FIRM|nr:hypothetical protein BACCAP_01643 [Pseudoflavonifractor capillosus ATCC 29799]